MAFIDHHISQSRIRVRRSTVSGEAPDVGELRPGEIAANTADGIMFVGKNDGTSAQVSGEVGEAPEDGTTYGRKDGEWVDITEPANLQVKLGTASEVAAYTPMSGEPVWDTTNKVLYVGDGASSGGVRVAYPVLVNNRSVPEQITSAAPESFAPLVLGPSGSVWQLDLFAKLQADWDLEANENITFRVSGFTGVGALTGSLDVVDSAGTATTKRLTTSDISIPTSGTIEHTVRLSAVAAVTASTGTVDFWATVDGASLLAAIKRWTLVARRLA